MSSTCPVTPHDYAFRLAMCVAASFELKLAPDASGYASLDQVMKNNGLAEKGGNEYLETETLVSHIVAAAKAEKEAGRHWKVKQLKVHGSNKALLLTNGKEVQVFFPGTELNKKSDILADLNLFPAPMIAYDVNGDKEVHCAVHKGFLQRTSEINDTIVRELHALSEKGQCDHLSINGYSLGAGMAAIFAVGLPQDLRDKVESIVPQASPHVGDDRFNHVIEALFDGKIHNVRNDFDPVAWIPRRFNKIPGEEINICGKSHEYHKAHRGFKNTITSLGKIGTDNPAIIKVFDGLAKLAGDGMQVENHSPMAYFRGIKALTNKLYGVLDDPTASPLIDRGQQPLTGMA